MLPLDPEAVSITDEAANVDDNWSAYEPVQRNLVNLFPVFVEVERRVDVGARVSAEAEGVNAASVSFRELDGRFSGEFGVLWVRGDIGFEGVSQVYDFGHLSGCAVFETVDSDAQRATFRSPKQGSSILM